MAKTAVVTGAGSGVGRAVAIALANDGWDVVLVSRTESALADTIRAAGEAGCRMNPRACDVGDESAVADLGRWASSQFGLIEVLVNAAGVNVPRRSLQELSSDDYHRVIDTNLNGAYYCVQAFLPAMRQAGRGTIVNVISDAALAASPKAGPSYVMSKFGLRGLTQAINAEERVRGVRATAILPGDIDTPLLNQRPTPPTKEQRAKMLQPEDVAECVMLAIRLPERAIVEELLVRPR